MKTPRILPAALLALLMSIGVTAGAVYVTVDAAARQVSSDVVPVVQSLPSPVFGTESGDSGQTAADVQLAEGDRLHVRVSELLAPAGELQGAAAATVTLRHVDGGSMKQTSERDGSCVFVGVKPGVYTIHVDSPQGRLSCGLRAVRPYSSVAHRSISSPYVPVSFVLNLHLDAALTLKRDDAALDGVLSRVRVNSVTEESAGSDAARVTADAVETALVQPTEDEQTSGGMSHQPALLNRDGSLDGRIVLLDPSGSGTVSVNNLTVSFITDNTVVAASMVNADGSFVQPNLLPGIYTLAVAGQDGVGYMGIDVVGGLAQSPQMQRTILTSLKRVIPLSLAIVQGEDGESDGTGDESKDDDEDGTAEDDGTGGGEEAAAEGTPAPGTAPLAAGGTTGGGSFGGGGFGDGYGGLLGLAAAGAAAALLADDDDTPASPAN